MKHRVIWLFLALAACVPEAPPPTVPAGPSPARPGTPMPDVGAAPAVAPVVEGAPQATVTVSEARVQPMPPGAPASAAYLTLENTGAAPLRLVRALSPAAVSVELHENIEQNGMMMMRPLSGPLEIAPGATLRLAPGGMHIMLIGIRSPLAEGDKVPLSLLFEDGSVAQAVASVAPPPSAAAGSAAP
jgi:copper(I)-binding protein